MNRLPINLLLYVAILGLLAGSGWQFYQAAVVERKTPEQVDEDQRQDGVRFAEKHATGAEGAGKIVVGPAYGQDPDFWNTLRDANFTGKEPPPPPPDPSVSTEPEKPVEVPQTPLEDIFVLTFITGAGADSVVIIHYKPESNVELPPDAIPPAPAAGPLDVATARPGGGNRPQLPAYGAGGLGPAHFLRLEDPLWKPFEHIRLVRIAPGGEGVVFVREDPQVPKEQWKEETIYPEALGLPQDVLRKLAEAGVATLADQARASTDGSDAAGPVQPSGWQPLEETTEIEGRYNIGTRDRERFRSNPERIFSEDIGTKDYRGSGVNGVQIVKIAPGYERFGVQPGDIIVAINGEPVGSKTEALKIGKAQYKRGVRTFEIEFLTKFGANLTRTYVAPDE